MTPCWWMPASWAKALRPTMALLGCTGTPVMLESIWLVRYSSWVAMPVSKGSRSRRTLRAITTSSREQLPARSPMPLMVHSTWRAPASTAARLLATARPRSLWQCTLRMAWSRAGTRRRSSFSIPANSSGTA